MNLLQLTPIGPTPGEAAPPVGLMVGSAVIGHFNAEVQPVSSKTKLLLCVRSLIYIVSFAA